MVMNFGRKTFDKEILQALDNYQARIIFDRSGNIIESNTNFLNTLGYAAGQLVGKHHRIFCEPAYVASDAYQTFWNDLAAGKAQLGTFKRLSSRGEPVYIQASYWGRLREGAESYAKALANDILR